MPPNPDDDAPEWVQIMFRANAMLPKEAPQWLFETLIAVGNGDLAYNEYWADVLAGKAPFFCIGP